MTSNTNLAEIVDRLRVRTRPSYGYQPLMDEAAEAIEHLQGERDHFYKQWSSCWAPLTPRSENEKRGLDRVLAILKSKLSDGGGIVGASDVQRAHNDYYRGRRVAFEECAQMLRLALEAESPSPETNGMGAKPIGYVTRLELETLRRGVSCVDLFGEVVPKGLEMVPLYEHPPTPEPPLRGSDLTYKVQPTVRTHARAESCSEGGGNRAPPHPYPGDEAMTDTASAYAMFFALPRNIQDAASEAAVNLPFAIEGEEFRQVEMAIASAIVLFTTPHQGEPAMSETFSNEPPSPREHVKVDVAQRVLGILDDFAGMQPEEGEDWESWYPAAFDLARYKIRAALAKAETSQ